MKDTFNIIIQKIWDALLVLYKYEYEEIND
jgi:hypothetical protein